MRYLSAMDIRLIRRANLATLIAEAGSVAKLHSRTGISEKYISQITTNFVGRGRKSRREIGHEMARRLEAGMNRREGWMDVSHNPTQPAAAGPKRAELDHSADEYEILALWRALFEEQRTELLSRLRVEAERARRIEQEMKRRHLDKAVPDGEVAKHLPPRPRQLPKTPPKKAGKA